MAMNKKGTTRQLRSFLLASSGYQTLPVRDDRSNISTASSDWLLTNVGRCLIIYPKVEQQNISMIHWWTPCFLKNIPIDDWLIFQHLPIYELVLFPMIFPFFFSHSYPQPWGFPTWVFVISRDPGPHVCERGPGLLPRWSHKGHRELSKGVVLVVLSLEAGLGKCSSWSSWKKNNPWIS